MRTRAPRARDHGNHDHEPHRHCRGESGCDEGARGQARESTTSVPAIRRCHSSNAFRSTHPEDRPCIRARHPAQRRRHGDCTSRRVARQGARRPGHRGRCRDGPRSMNFLRDNGLRRDPGLSYFSKPCHPGRIRGSLEGPEQTTAWAADASSPCASPPSGCFQGSCRFPPRARRTEVCAAP